MNLRNFKIISLLGEGGYGRVYLGVCKDNLDKVQKGQAVAIKVVTKKYVKSIETEIKVSTIENTFSSVFFLFILSHAALP